MNGTLKRISSYQYGSEMKMNKIEFNIDPVAECSVLVTLKSAYSSNVTQSVEHSSSADDSRYMAHFSAAIRQHFASVLMNVTPAYHTILVDYLPYRISEQQFVEQLNTLLTQSLSTLANNHSRSNVVELPAYYSKETALDLERYQHKGLSLDSVIAYHTSQIYHVSAIGFIPGFAFMSDVPDELVLPRHATPRLTVPKGSIAIAGSKTAVYPSDSPGGWNIIGNCPLSLFNYEQLINADITSQGLSLLNVGDSVQFKAITKKEFIELGGVLNG